MRILVLNYEYPPLGGGAAPVTKELMDEISSDHILDLVTMHYPGLKKEEHGKVNIYRVNSLRARKEKSNFIEMLLYLIAGYLKVRKLTRSNKYDLIHAHFIIPTGILAYLFRNKCPYVITSHGSDVPGYNPDRFIFMHKLLAPFWKQVVRNAAAIVTPSVSLKTLLSRSIDVEVEVIPNGIHFQSTPKPKKDKIILYAGRLFKRKGVQYLIEACATLPEGWKVVIAGDGDYRAKLEKLAEGRNIEFLGWIDKQKLNGLYRKSSIFVLPSDEESFGMVIAEAMTYHCAVISTKGTGCQEVVGEAGILVDKADPEQLRKALLGLIDNPARLSAYQKSAYERARLFDWKKISQKYLDVFKKKINGTRF